MIPPVAGEDSTEAERNWVSARVSILSARAETVEQPGDRMGLMRDIGWAMYAIARPGAHRP